MGDEATGNGEFGIGEPCIATCGEHMKAVRLTTCSHGWVFVLFVFQGPFRPPLGQRAFRVKVKKMKKKGLGSSGGEWGYDF